MRILILRDGQLEEVDMPDHLAGRLHERANWCTAIVACLAIAAFAMLWDYADRRWRWMPDELMLIAALIVLALAPWIIGALRLRLLWFLQARAVDKARRTGGWGNPS